MTMLHPAQYQHAQINRLSLRVYRAAWAVSLPASTKLVLLAICSHINDTTGYANLSVARIAGLCAMHERTTQVHMRKLTALGLLATGRMPGMRVCAYRGQRRSARARPSAARLCRARRTKPARFAANGC